MELPLLPLGEAMQPHPPVGASAHLRLPFSSVYCSLAGQLSCWGSVLSLPVDLSGAGVLLPPSGVGVGSWHVAFWHVLPAGHAQSRGQVEQFSPLSPWHALFPQSEASLQLPLWQSLPAGHPQSLGHVVQFSPCAPSQALFPQVPQVPLRQNLPAGHPQSLGHVVQFSPFAPSQALFPQSVPTALQALLWQDSPEGQVQSAGHVPQFSPLSHVPLPQPVAGPVAQTPTCPTLRHVRPPGHAEPGWQIQTLRLSLACWQEPPVEQVPEEVQSSTQTASLVLALVRTQTRPALQRFSPQGWPTSWDAPG